MLYGNVSTDGVVDEFEGPGYVVVDNDKITVNPPGEFVWGYNSPYLQAKIVPDGIDIFNNKTNQTVGHIDPKTMTNDTIPGQRVNVETLKYWYNHYGQGSKYNLDYCINGFNDNRSYITPDMLKEKFPEAYEYLFMVKTIQKPKWQAHILIWILTHNTMIETENSMQNSL